MAVETFDPTGILGELNALGVRFVLVGDFASQEIPVFTTNRMEICVADDEEDIDRLRVLLAALEAAQVGPSDDPHRAVFLTRLGELEFLEMPAHAEFAELERRAGHVDFGNGLIVRAVPRLDTSAHQRTPAGPVVEDHEPPDREPEAPAEEREPVTRRIWQKLEPKLERIDDLLSGSGRSGAE